MRRHRVVGSLAAATVAVSLLSPGNAGANSSSFTPVGTYPIVKQPITLQVFMLQNPSVEDLSTNGFTKQVEQLTNIHLDWVAAPESDYATKFQLALTSGSYPAVFMHGEFTKAQLEQYGQQGVLVNLKPLIDKYAPHIKAAMQAIPLLTAAMTAPNGAIYDVPSYNACFHCWVSQRAWINQRWLKALHLQMPTTTAQFVQVLQAFKKAYPNTVPLDGEGPGNQDFWQTNMVPFFMNSFIYDDGSDYLNVANKKVQFAAMQPQWRDGLTYLHQLWTNGLIDQAAFTQKYSDMVALGNKSPEAIGVFTNALVGGMEPFAPGQTQWKDYAPLSPLQGPSGVRMTPWYRSVGLSVFEITNKATPDEQIAAIRLADYLYTMDGAEGMEFGPRGVMWHPAKKGMLGLDGQPALYYGDPTWWGLTTQNYHWNQNGPNYRPRWIFDARWSGNGDPSYNGSYEEFLYKLARDAYFPYHAPYSMVFPADAWINPADAQALSQIQTNITNYVSTWTTQFITGQKNLQSDWNSYVQGFQGLQMAQYLAIYQRTYDGWSKTYPPSFLAPEGIQIPSNASLFTAVPARQ